MPGASTFCREGGSNPPAFNSTLLLHPINNSTANLNYGELPIDKWIARQEKSLSHQNKDAAMPSLPAPVRAARASTKAYQVTRLLRPCVSPQHPTDAPPVEHTPKKSHLYATSVPRRLPEATSSFATSASSTPETTQKQGRRISTAGNLTRAMHARLPHPSRIQWTSRRNRCIR